MAEDGSAPHSARVRPRAHGALQQRLPPLLHQPARRATGRRKAARADGRRDPRHRRRGRRPGRRCGACSPAASRCCATTSPRSTWGSSAAACWSASSPTPAWSRPAHVELFQTYPPRDIEVTVYGATRGTYEAVTRRPGSFDAFMRGLDLLLAGGLQGAPQGHGPALQRARARRASPASAASAPRTTSASTRCCTCASTATPGATRRSAPSASRPRRSSPSSAPTPSASGRCEAGLRRAAARPPMTSTVLRPPLPLRRRAGQLHRRLRRHLPPVLARSGTPTTVYDLRRRHAARGVGRRSCRTCATCARSNAEFLERCRRCAIINLCLWCPAHAALETGEMDEWVEYFCEVAHARAAAVGVANT